MQRASGAPPPRWAAPAAAPERGSGPVERHRPSVRPPRDHSKGPEGAPPAAPATPAPPPPGHAIPRDLGFLSVAVADDLWQHPVRIWRELNEGPGALQYASNMKDESAAAPQVPTQARKSVWVPPPNSVPTASPPPVQRRRPLSARVRPSPPGSVAAAPPSPRRPVPPALRKTRDAQMQTDVDRAASTAFARAVLEKHGVTSMFTDDDGDQPFTRICKDVAAALDLQLAALDDEFAAGTYTEAASAVPSEHDLSVHFRDFELRRAPCRYAAMARLFEDAGMHGEGSSSASSGRGGIAGIDDDLLHFPDDLNSLGGGAALSASPSASPSSAYPQPAPILAPTPPTGPTPGPGTSPPDAPTQPPQLSAPAGPGDEPTPQRTLIAPPEEADMALVAAIAAGATTLDGRSLPRSPPQLPDEPAPDEVQPQSAAPQRPAAVEEAQQLETPSREAPPSSGQSTEHREPAPEQEQPASRRKSSGKAGPRKSHGITPRAHGQPSRQRPSRRTSQPPSREVTTVPSELGERDEGDGGPRGGEAVQMTPSPSSSKLRKPCPHCPGLNAAKANLEAALLQALTQHRTARAELAVVSELLRRREQELMLGRRELQQAKQRATAQQAARARDAELHAAEAEELREHLAAARQDAAHTRQEADELLAGYAQQSRRRSAAMPRAPATAERRQTLADQTAEFVKKRRKEAQEAELRAKQKARRTRRMLAMRAVVGRTEAQLMALHDADADILPEPVPLVDELGSSPGGSVVAGLRRRLSPRQGRRLASLLNHGGVSRMRSPSASPTQASEAEAESQAGGDAPLLSLPSPGAKRPLGWAAATATTMMRAVGLRSTAMLRRLYESVGKLGAMASGGTSPRVCAAVADVQNAVKTELQGIVDVCAAWLRESLLGSRGVHKEVQCGVHGGVNEPPEVFATTSPRCSSGAASLRFLRLHRALWTAFEKIHRFRIRLSPKPLRDPLAARESKQWLQGAAGEDPLVPHRQALSLAAEDLDAAVDADLTLLSAFLDGYLGMGGGLRSASVHSPQKSGKERTLGSSEDQSPRPPQDSPPPLRRRTISAVSPAAATSVQARRKSMQQWQSSTSERWEARKSWMREAERQRWLQSVETSSPSKSDPIVGATGATSPRSLMRRQTEVLLRAARDAVGSPRSAFAAASTQQQHPSESSVFPIVRRATLHAADHLSGGGSRRTSLNGPPPRETSGGAHGEPPPSPDRAAIAAAGWRAFNQSEQADAEGEWNRRAAPSIVLFDSAGELD
eukprot:TRINITY_DN6616_c0_g1_i1.p1 TRINITY_DN6616_c0_g1~~TRINITY_DN6616_c0_g1_i1.p1  ORF type:complete len:1277 (+),score=255.94 TRINITY_DN6616_c0_g1_i1:60-3833(+)